MKCPGQDTQYWAPGAIFETKCPQCGHLVEFFKDDTTRKCEGCGHRFVNPKMDFGCASYCQFAEQCLGTLPPELLAQKEDLLKDRVAIEMKRYFRKDFKRIGHASRVARYAERIGIEEMGNLAVILTAAYLHDIGIPEAERRGIHDSPSAHEEIGPEVAREILSGLGAQERLIDEVCDIIAHHHHPGPEENVNFKVVHDADLIVNLEEEQKRSGLDVERLRSVIRDSFLTDSGRLRAEKVLINDGNQSG